MIPLSRPPVPTALSGRMAVKTAEIERAGPADRVTVARARWRGAPAVRTSLRELLGTMATGRQCCMYCGDGIGTDIDHFEPLALAPTRTFEWINHLLACSTCNSHQKRERFPKDALGSPQLIDPTAEDPGGHILLTLSLGEYAPLTDRGRTTIDVFALNRPLLVRGRQQARRVVVGGLRDWLRADQEADQRRQDEAVLTIREQPCADVVHAMLAQATSRRAALIFDADRDVLPALLDERLRAAVRA